MPRPPDVPDAMNSPGSSSDIDGVCAALGALKQQLQRIAAIGGDKRAPSEGLLLAAADDCADAVIISDDRAVIQMVNGAAARLTGYSTRELQTLTVWDISDATSQGDFDILWKEFLRAGRQRGRYCLRHREGAAVEVAYCAEANVLPQRHVSVLRRAATS